MVRWLLAHLCCKTLLCMRVNVVCSAFVRICETVLIRVILDLTLKLERACQRVGVVLQHDDAPHLRRVWINQHEAAFKDAR